MTEQLRIHNFRLTFADIDANADNFVEVQTHKIVKWLSVLVQNQEMCVYAIVDVNSEKRLTKLFLGTTGNEPPLGLARYIGTGQFVGDRNRFLVLHVFHVTSPS